jgi:hypothetical protein
VAVGAEVGLAVGAEVGVAVGAEVGVAVVCPFPFLLDFFIRLLSFPC